MDTPTDEMLARSAYRLRIPEIQKEIGDLMKRLDELNKDHLTALREEGLSGDHEVSDRYALAIEQVGKRLQSLHAEFDSLTPCGAFEERVGEWLHDLYRERYPINMDTIVRDVPASTGSTWVYHLPMFFDARLFRSGGYIMPAGPMPEEHSAGFETIVHDGLSVRLAYAPEINTIFISRMERVPLD